MRLVVPETNSYELARHSESIDLVRAPNVVMPKVVRPSKDELTEHEQRMDQRLAKVMTEVTVPLLAQMVVGPQANLHDFLMSLERAA